jgi:hypothetical protein
MPAQANDSAANRISPRTPGNSNPKALREPSLHDLRRRLVGLRYGFVRRLTVTLVMVGCAALLASRLSPQRLATEYPAAVADSRLAMAALAANVRGVIGHACEGVATILAARQAPARRPTATVALAGSAATMRSRHGFGQHASWRRKIASAERRRAPVRIRVAQDAGAAPTIDDTASVVADGDAANWLMNRFPVELDHELSKAYYKLLDFACDAITLEWAPDLRDSIESSIQSLTDRLGSGDGFSISDLTSLLKSIATSNGLVTVGAGLLLFTLLAGFSAWLRRMAGA